VTVHEVGSLGPCRWPHAIPIPECLSRRRKTRVQSRA